MDTRGRWLVHVGGGCNNVFCNACSLAGAVAEEACSGAAGSAVVATAEDCEFVRVLVGNRADAGYKTQAGCGASAQLP